MDTAHRSSVIDIKAPRATFVADAIADTPREIARLGVVRPLLIVSRSQRDVAVRLSKALGESCAGVFDDVRMHVPKALVHDAFTCLQSSGADSLACIGGGSALGLGKALALRTQLPIVAVPTTYAGSEATPIYGITGDGIKETGRSPSVLPKSIIYDPSLTLTLPIRTTVTSGLNALAHALEALYAYDASSLLNLISVEAVRLLADALPRAVAAPQDRMARHECQYGAYLCGVALGNASMGLHHKACHVLGGAFDLPHAELHAALLPYSIAYNETAAPELCSVTRLLGATSCAAGLKELAVTLGAPLSLREIGLKEPDLVRAADLICEKPYPNPQPLEPSRIHSMLRSAYRGTAPCVTC